MEIAYGYLAPPEILRSKSKVEGDEEDYTYMYQISTGDNVFLLPFNFKCLLDEYEAFAYLPTTIKGKIIEVNNFKLDSNLIKKYK